MSGDQSHMRTDSVDESLFVKYLLGRLTEEEEVQIEDRAFADRAYMSALNAAEADLVALPHLHGRILAGRCRRLRNRLRIMEFSRRAACGAIRLRGRL